MPTTLYDVLRYIVRNQGHANSAVEQDLLLTIDGSEGGYADLESYKEALAQKAREDNAQASAELAGPRAPADTTSALTDEQLEAELARRQAIANASVPRTATPIPTPASTPPADAPPIAPAAPPFQPTPGA